MKSMNEPMNDLVSAEVFTPCVSIEHVQSFVSEGVVDFVEVPKKW